MTKSMIAVSAALLATLAMSCSSKKGDGSGASRSEMVAKMSELRDRMCACKDLTCARKVSDEVTAYTRENAAAKKQNKLDEAATKEASEIGKQLQQCMTAAMGGIGSGAAGAATSGDATTGSGSAGSGSDAPDSAPGSAAGSADEIGALPKQCEAYKAAVDRLATCDKLTKQARQTLLDGYAKAAEGWKKLPKESMANVKGSCDAGAKSVIAVAKQHCGW